MEVLDKLLALTADKSKSHTKARALYYRGKVAAADGTNDLAVKDYRSALEVVPNLFGDDRIEEAEINEALADSQFALGLHLQARGHWEVAAALYNTMVTPEALSGRNRVGEKLAKLKVSSPD